MAKKIRVADLPEFDAAEYLDSGESNAEYLTAMIEGGMRRCWQRRWVILPALEV